MRNLRLLLVFAAAVLASGCDGGTGPSSDTRTDAELDFVTVAADAPPLETMDTSFFAVRGDNRELEIRFQGSGGSGTGSRFLRLEVDDEALLRRPDGTMFAEGDSILISVSVDSARFVVSFEPSGLEFNPNEPAELEIRYDKAAEEFLEREVEFEFWRQEVSGGPWERLNSLQVEEIDKMETDLLGFTRFALAI